MMMSKNNQNANDLLVQSMKFEVMDNFMHQEVNERILLGNRCYYTIVKLLKSKLLSWASKLYFYPLAICTQL